MTKSYYKDRVEEFSSGRNMIKLIKSSFYNEEKTKKALVDFILDTDRLSMGEQCLQFEYVFSEKQERSYSTFVSSGSSANLLLLQALINVGYLDKGDSVGFSALTWPTNVMPIIQLGLVPVPLDCNPKTLNVSPQILEKKADKLQCVFLTNVLGFSDDISKIKKICEDKDILLIEDNCESLGSRVDATLLGNFGLASTFSFFVGHHMSTIEGGMVCTDDKDLNNAIIMARAHGWDRNLHPDDQKTLRKKHGIDEFYSRYTFYDLAYNSRPSEIGGFLGNEQIQYLDEIITKRSENFNAFHEATLKNDDFQHFDLSHMDVISNFAMPVICRTNELSIRYKHLFTEANVEIRPIIAGSITKQPFYKKYSTKEKPSLVSEEIHNNGFYFGNNPEMTQDEVSKLCRLLVSGLDD